MADARALLAAQEYVAEACHQSQSGHTTPDWHKCRQWPCVLLAQPATPVGALEMELPPLTKREEFEALRYCRQCGRRLIYAQYDTATAQVLTKRCPERDPALPFRESPHEFIEVEQPMPHRDRRGHLTRGSKARLAAANEPAGGGEG